METQQHTGSTKEAFVSAWERLEPVIRDSIDRLGDKGTVEGIYDNICDGRCYFFAGQKTFAVGYIIAYEKCRVFNCFLAGGDGAELLDDLVPLMERFAKTAGCRWIEMDVRPGFVKRGDHTKRGYKLRTMCVTKDLCDG